MNLAIERVSDAGRVGARCCGWNLRGRLCDRFHGTSENSAKDLIEAFAFEQAERQKVSQHVGRNRN